MLFCVCFLKIHPWKVSYFLRKPLHRCYKAKASMLELNPLYDVILLPFDMSSHNTFEAIKALTRWTTVDDTKAHFPHKNAPTHAVEAYNTLKCALQYLEFKFKSTSLLKCRSWVFLCVLHLCYLLLCLSSLGRIEGLERTAQEANLSHCSFTGVCGRVRSMLRVCACTVGASTYAGCVIFFQEIDVL